MSDELKSQVAQEIGKQVASEATKGFIERISDFYNTIVGVFPEQYQWIVSLIILLAVASTLFNLIRKNIVWIILAIVIFPGLLPILKNLFDSLTALLTGKPIE